MDLNEILNRKSPSVYSVEEMQFVVEKYIKFVKNVEVNINIYKGIDINNLNQIDVIRLHNEHNRLFNAFNIAHKEILKNGYKN